MIENRIDRYLKSARWPELCAVENLHFQDGDVLLVCAGFEDRVTTVLEMAETARARGITVLDCEYAPPIDSNHFPQIQKLCADANWGHVRVEYDRRNPASIFNKIISNLPIGIRRLYIDISGMSRLLIVQMIVGLIEHGIATESVSILYTEAESYPPSEAEARTRLANNSSEAADILSFISAGVYDLAVVPELSSLTMSSAPTRLIAFPSFNPAQLFSAKSIIQPANTTLIHGVPPDPALHWRTDAICQLNQISDNSENQDLKIDTLDYSECLRLLLTLYDEWAEYFNLVLSPTGSKMQTVAVGIFRGFVRDVQIVYPTPLRFMDPTDHTHGAKRVYELKLDSFIRLRNRLASSRQEDQ